MSYAECAFDLGGDFYLRGRRWGNPDGLPVLALHGWLDNCASFDFLAPRLAHLNLIALDLAGHGRSDHRNYLGAYDIWQDIGEIYAVADRLGWESFGLIGHSRGAIVAMLAAGTFPERISHLGLLDGIIPFVGQGGEAPETLAKSIQAVAQQVARPRRYYASFEDAVTAREKTKFALDRPDAEALAQRGVEKFEPGYAWLYDSKLLAPSQMRLTLEQAEAFFARIQASLLLLVAEDSFLREHAMLQHWLEQHSDVPRVSLPGGHHFHMSTGADAVAEALTAGLEL